MIAIQCIPDLRERMLAAVLHEGEGAMDMEYCSTFVENFDDLTKYPCGTVCCIAGWAINCHPQGAAVLAEIVEAGPYAFDSSGERMQPESKAARLILDACRIPSPNFYDMDDVGDYVGESANRRAMNWLRTGEQK